MKDKSLLWIDGFNTKKQAKGSSLLLSNFIERPIINTIDEEMFDTNSIEYQSKPVSSAHKGRHIKTTTLRGHKKELKVSIKQPIMNKIMTCFVLGIISLFPFAMIESPYTTMDFFIIGFFGLIISIIVLAVLFNNKKYRLIKDEKGIEVKLESPALPTKKELSVYVEFDNIQDIQLHRLDNGHYWLSLLLHDYDLKFSDMLNFNIGAFSKNAIKKTIDKSEQQLGLWEVPAHQKDIDGLSFENLAFIKNWIRDSS